MTNSQKAVQQKSFKMGERRKKYDLDIMFKVLKAVSEGSELRSRLYYRTELSNSVVMEYAIRLINMGLMKFLTQQEASMCPTCHRKIKPDKRVAITEKGMTYLRKMQEAQDILLHTE